MRLRTPGTIVFPTILALCASYRGTSLCLKVLAPFFPTKSVSASNASAWNRPLALLQGPFCFFCFFGFGCFGWTALRLLPSVFVRCARVSLDHAPCRRRPRRPLPPPRRRRHRRRRRRPDRRPRPPPRPAGAPAAVRRRRRPRWPPSPRTHPRRPSAPAAPSRRRANGPAAVVAPHPGADGRHPWQYQASCAHDVASCARPAQKAAPEPQKQPADGPRGPARRSWPAICPRPVGRVGQGTCGPRRGPGGRCRAAGSRPEAQNGCWEARG